ncbi:DUF4136 domain-containing protein [Pseudoalteromonas denitrificans]|uniref:DUF4136 domain-containing protein n=1 Tax=Pseudoalteromonas denitrificans DSM 6059 TaxID=1123010 RepID=A0A1I1FRV8_9GAMM|nr:DUF4136 domain-containing protein [Pseudoalteromonas denitrificans]SFB99730.1 protein of unknown function [Pseudoalteromonas denitrificans DSM 6059]
MKQIKIILLASIIILLTACAAPGPNVNFDKNPNINISSAKTFAWLKESKALHISAGFNPIVKVRIDKAIEQALENKGYTFVTDTSKADLAVSYTVGSRDKIQIDSYPATFQGGFGWGRGYYGRYGRIGMSTETHVRNYTQGELAIDIYDVKTKQPAWHGWATKKLTKDDKENIEGLIKLIVSSTLANF